ncbi:MAG: serine hydrolase domain-containing protein, partial [Bacteroidota bacterium]
MQKYLFLLFFIGCGPLVLAQTASNPSFQEAENKLQDLIQEKKCVGLAAGIFQGKAVLWKAAAGYQEAESQTTFTTQTLSRIASITKPMTAIAIMQLFEQGKIDLNAPIQTYLPDFPQKPQGSITIQQLLGHSSGMDAYASRKEINNQKNYVDLQAALEHIQDRDLVAVPGNEFHYTSYGYVVLGRIIEKVSGMNYETYLKKNIWEPAGMENTSLEKYGQAVAHKSLIYHKDKKGKIRKEAFTNLSDRVPGGGVQSTLEDLLTFGKAVLTNQLVKAETLER